MELLCKKYVNNLNIFSMNKPTFFGLCMTVFYIAGVLQLNSAVLMHVFEALV